MSRGTRRTTWGHRAGRIGLVLTLMSLMLTTNFAGMALAKEGANLSQCGNGDADDGPPTPCAWQNGNLGQNNSQYAEGDGVGFRSILEDLQDGDTYEFTIGWDTIQTDSIAYDYLVSWDFTESGDPAAATGYAGSGSDSTIAIPVDPRIANEGVAQAAGQFEAWGLNLTGVSAYSYEDGGAATDPLPLVTMETTVTVTFVVATGGTGEAVLAWGGHIATTPDWAPRTTAAVAVNGAPYHMRLNSLYNVTDDDDINLGNIDRSLNADAIEVAPELTILKEASAGTVAPGGSFAYTITVTNNGTGDATNVTVNDTVDGAFTVTDITPSQGSCDPVSNNVSCDLGTIGAGAQASIAVDVSVPTTPDSCQTVGNIASVSADDIEAVDSANVDVTIDGCAPDLSLAKSNDTGGAAAPGDSFVWTLTTTNSGAATATATDIQVTDTIPAGLNVTNVAGDAGVDCSASSGNSVDCTIATLAAGASADVDVTVSVPDTDSCGSYPNTGTLTDDAQTVDTDEDTVVVAGCSADLSIGKTNDTGGGAVPAESFTWTLTVTNSAQASGTATGLIVTDTIPAGLTVTDITADAGVDCSGSSGNDVDCTIASLDPGASVDIDVTVSVPAVDGCGDYPNTGVLADDGGVLDAALDTVLVRGCAFDLSIVKTNDTGGDAAPGAPFTWTLTVANDAGASASAIDAVVTDQVPVALDVTGVAADAGVDCGASSGNNVDCTIATLAPGDSVAIDITVSAPDANGCGLYLNTGELTVGQEPLADDDDTVSVTGCGIDVTVAKTASSGQVGLGGSLTWTIVATNSEQATESATNVDIIDDVPAPLVVTDVNSVDADCTASIGNTVNCDAGDLGPGESATVTVTTSVPADGPVCHTFTNTADALVDNEPADSDDADVTVVGCLAAIDLVKTADLDAIDGIKTALHDPGDDDEESIGYFYDITNVGTVTLTAVTLVDNILGELLTLDEGVSLAPGETITVMAKHVLTDEDAATGQVVNIAIASGLDPENQPVEDQDDETVLVDQPTGEVELAETGGEVVPLFGISNLMLVFGAAFARLGSRMTGAASPSGRGRVRGPFGRPVVPPRHRRRPLKN